MVAKADDTEGDGCCECKISMHSHGFGVYGALLILYYPIILNSDCLDSKNLCRLW